MEEKARANQMLLTPEFIEYERSLAIANNTKQVFGALPATLWAPRDIGYSTTGV